MATAPIVLSIGDTVSINGQLFVVSATLVPTSTAPPPPPPPPVPSPSVNEFRDATRSFAVSSIPGGGTFWMNGTNFGATTGSLSVNTLPLQIQHWDDQWIEATAPPFVAGAGPGNWVLKRSDATSAGGYVSFLGPAITSPPPAGLNRE